MTMLAEGWGLQDAANLIAVVGGIVALPSAFIAVVAAVKSRKAEKEAAQHAKETVEAAKRSAAAQEESNRLEREKIEAKRVADLFVLEVWAEFVPNEQQEMELVVHVANTSKEVVGNIQDVRMVFLDRLAYNVGHCEGQLENPRTGKELWAYSTIPGTLKPGTAFDFVFKGPTTSYMGQTQPIDFTAKPWCDALRIEVQANNNHVFPAPESWKSNLEIMMREQAKDVNG